MEDIENTEQVESQPQPQPQPQPQAQPQPQPQAQPQQLSDEELAQLALENPRQFYEYLKSTDPDLQAVRQMRIEMHLNALRSKYPDFQAMEPEIERYLLSLPIDHARALVNMPDGLETVYMRLAYEKQRQAMESTQKTSQTRTTTEKQLASTVGTGGMAPTGQAQVAQDLLQDVLSADTKSVTMLWEK